MSKHIFIKYIAIIYIYIANYYLIVSALPQNRLYIKTIALEPICTDNETGKKLLVGESLNRNNMCTRIQCIGDENIWQYECNVPGLTGDCQPIDGMNPEGLYPECCPRYLCIQRLSNGNYIETIIYDHYGNVYKKTSTQLISVINVGYTRSNTTKLINDVVR